MNIQSQNQNRKKILITGGTGDIAKGVLNILKDSYEIYSPKTEEMDVTSLISVRDYFRDKLFDIVVNTAGTLYSSRVIDSDPEKWIRDVNVNLIGTYLVCREALIHNSKTKIINISSTAGFNSYLDWTSYCASKAGVLKLSGGLFKDGYDVVTMCPGAIDTKIRNSLNIDNSNVMSIEEGIKPIVDAVEGVYSSGNIVIYRQNSLEILDEN
tara:strand:+ start:177 stop:809 length:633 start_codon:yes stop_codon:yes gene_type:complete